MASISSLETKRSFVLCEADCRRLFYVMNGEFPGDFSAWLVGAGSGVVRNPRD